MKQDKDLSSLVDVSPVSEAHAHSAGLSMEEYDRIKRLLGRDLNKVELGIIGAMWSEHCSYKSSRAHLSKLQWRKKGVLVGPGENAGVIDIGDGLAVVFKIESHNHPSFIEPVQGAATGVGGILRDIFTMGARPFAVANLLRFGEPEHARVPYLMHGVVSGLSSYGNCFGVPTVLSNVDFHESYNGNNLVNAFAIGVVRCDEIFLGKAQGVKNRVLYVGAKTGRDGIMGAVMASDVFDENSRSKRPTVQVGDPFTEKLLYEACLMVFKEKLVVGIQDMGAAGLTCSTFEMAHRACTGLFINLDNVPLRDESMSAYDIMLSESQERMLMVVRPEDVKRIREIFSRFELDCVDIGHVTGDGLVKIHHRGRDVASLSATMIIENAPRYRRSYLSEVPFEHCVIKDRVDFDLNGAVEFFHRSYSQHSLRWITDQFDHHIGLNTIVGPDESDAALIKVPESQKAVAIALLANGRLCRMNPFEGARRIVFEASLNVYAQGAKPIGISDCLNFASPEDTAVMTELKHVIDGMAEAATELDIPIISGNVSLYNETENVPILPTLALSLVGLSDDGTRCFTKFSRCRPEQSLVLMGELPEDYAGCEPIIRDAFVNRALRAWDKRSVMAMGEILRQGVEERVIGCASVIGHGGLLRSLIAIMAKADVGMTLDFGAEWLSQDIVVGMLSEDTPRVLMCLDQGDVPWLIKRCQGNIPINCLGAVGGDHLSIQHMGKTVLKRTKGSLIASFTDGLGEFLDRN